MTKLRRRDFLKAVGLAGASAALGGCSEPTRLLIPYIIPAEDVIPGEATWYATTCRECPAGCGLLAKNRDGHVIKVEGNPLHPINKGKLCPRGQASLHGLYNPDRFQGPMERKELGRLSSISWDQAQETLLGSLKEIVQKGRGERIAFVTGLMTGTLKDLVGHWLLEMGGAESHLMYEPFAYEPLRKANQIVFGQNTIPSYRIDRADFLISFNAGFLETWLSNVEYAGQFAHFRTVSPGNKNPFVFVGPRLSMTANNADLWVAVPPGDEFLFALGMLRIILEEDLSNTLGGERKEALRALVNPWPLERISTKTGVSEKVIRNVAHKFVKAKRPLALASGLPMGGPHATETAVAANLLCTINPGTLQAIDFRRTSAYGDVAKAESLRVLADRMRHGEIDMLLLHDANPIFSLPPAWEFQKSMEAVPTIVSFSSTNDETTALAHLILPTHTPLESWGDYSPRSDVVGLMQPVMGLLFQSRHLGDLLVSSGQKVKGNKSFPWKDFYEMLQDAWRRKRMESGSNLSDELFWQEAMKRGGLWDSKKAMGPEISLQTSSFAFPDPDSFEKMENEFHFTAYPTVQFFDGRNANRPWLQELPDPMTQVTWGGWVEIHPDTSARLNIQKNDLLRLRSQHGTVEAPALPIPLVPPGTLAMPIGQGHESYGQFADGRPANPLHLFSPQLDALSGGILQTVLTVSIERRGTSHSIANTDGDFYQHGRGFAQTAALGEYVAAVQSGREPQLDLPLPEGYRPSKDFYPPHAHSDYRWCMVVDLDRCIGCSACVIACYAENNVAIVGKERVLKNREMSWLRVQRYFDEKAPVALWLPMLCQHCDCAPCESVCPVYAPHHSKEGLNNQIYNRCFGTRFCHQNDPYKVRRFNFFTYTRPEPLNWQLNPDVLVRQKGVMEKCSFCVQRIIEAKAKARDAGRKVRDGDFTTACAQTCPTEALTFGNLLDPNSRVSRMIKDPRAYQVLVHLNTKPAVFYLKRVTQDLCAI